MCEDILIKQMNTRELIEKKIITQEKIPEFIRHLNPVVADREDEGVNNHGVFSVNTYLSHSSVALKVIKANVFNYELKGYSSVFRPDKLLNGLQPGENAYGFHQYVLTHYLLGQLSIAPKILGIISHSELIELYENEQNEYSYIASMGNKSKKEDYKGNLKKKPGHVGILMEELNRDWQLSRRRGVTDQFLDWSEEDIVNGFKQMDHIRNILIKYRIFAADMQLVVTKEKKIYLIDLDGFHFYEDDEPLLPYSFKQEYERLIYGWEVANNKSLSAHIRKEWDEKFPSYEGFNTSTMPSGMSRPREEENY